MNSIWRAAELLFTDTYFVHQATLRFCKDSDSLFVVAYPPLALLPAAVAVAQAPAVTLTAATSAKPSNELIGFG